MNIDQLKHARIKKWVTVGLIGLTGLLVSPIIFLTIKGIIGLIIAAFIGLAVVSFSPWVAMKFANWKVKAIVHEAATNPIETMTNLLLAKKEAWGRFKDQVTASATARDNFKTKMDAFVKKYPERAPEFIEKYEAMSELVERQKRALSDAKKAITLGEEKLTEMQAYWEMSQAAQEANQAMGMNTGDLYEKLKADTACDAVFESMNRAFAQLEVEAATESEETSKISYNPTEVIEMPVTQTQKVRA